MISISLSELINMTGGAIEENDLLQYPPTNDLQQLVELFQQQGQDRNFSFPRVMVEEISMKIPAHLSIVPERASSQQSRLMITLPSPLLSPKPNSVSCLRATFCSFTPSPLETFTKHDSL